MVNSGVVAESVISYKMTWKNPGTGKQPLWSQYDQEIRLHSSNIYPDLYYLKAQGLATYYKYTSVESIVNLLRDINKVIDNIVSNINENTNLLSQPNTSLQTIPKTSTAVQTIPKTSTAIEVVKPNDLGGQSKTNVVSNDSFEINDTGDSGGLGPYTVIVYGDRLKMIDGQTSSNNIRIRHRASDNMIRNIPENPINNSEKIWAIVKFKGSRSIKLEMEHFTNKDGLNLLVEILPAIDIILTPDEKNVSPKSEQEVEYRDRIKLLHKIRTNKEADRFNRVKIEIDSDRKQATKTK